MNILSERNRTKKTIWLLIYLFLLGWEDKQKVAKEAYDVEYKAWLEGGGAEAIKQVPSTQFLFIWMDTLNKDKRENFETMGRKKKEEGSIEFEAHFWAPTRRYSFFISYIRVLIIQTNGPCNHMRY